jgi:hypothetical protein
MHKGWRGHARQAHAPDLINRVRTRGARPSLPSTVSRCGEFWFRLSLEAEALFRLLPRDQLFALVAGDGFIRSFIRSPNRLRHFLGRARN